MSFISSREYDGRDDLRSLADALAKLDECDHLTDDDWVEIRSSGVNLPDGRKTAFVAVLGPCRSEAPRAIIRMPSSGQFSGRTTRGERQSFGIDMLDCAVSDIAGNVRLANGTYLHAIELVPSPFLRDLTDAEEEVVECAIKILGEEDRCYLPCHETLPPDVQLLHYENVAQIRIPSLKVLQDKIREIIPGVTARFIAHTLRFACMRTRRTS